MIESIQKEAVKSLYSVSEAAELLKQDSVDWTITVEDTTHVKFTTPKYWASGKEIAVLDDDDETEAILSVSGKDYPLTKRALEALGLKYHVTRKYMSLVPAALLEPHMNYWLENRTDTFRLLMHKDQVVGLSKSPKSPLFSSLEILETSAAAFSKAVGVSIPDLYVDYKLGHTLDSTSFRLINPSAAASIKSQRDGLSQEDVWSTGLAVNHSQSGQFSTSFEAYMFAWFCTNGAIATHASSGKFDRRSHGDEYNELEEWASTTIGDILLDLPDQFKDVEALTEVDLKGEMADAAAAVFKRFRVPSGSQDAVLNELVETDDWSAYGLMNAITQAANPSDTDEATRNQLFRAAGNMAAAYTERCDHCHRI